MEKRNNVQEACDADNDNASSSIDLSDFLRGQGNTAFKMGQYEDAVKLYSQAIEKLLLRRNKDEAESKYKSTVNVLLCNRCIAYFKAGSYGNALDDAVQSYVQSNDVAARSKAKYWEAKSLLKLNRLPEAIDALRIGLRISPHEQRLVSELQKSVHSLSSSQLAKLWTSIIEHASRPSSMSSRDGKYLKPVTPTNANLDSTSLSQHLATLFERDVEKNKIEEEGNGSKTVNARSILHNEAASMLCKCWSRGRDFPMKESMAAFRALAYLRAGNSVQCMKDAKSAIAYAQRPGWSRAHAVKAIAHERLAEQSMKTQKSSISPQPHNKADTIEYSLAALEITRAIELLDQVPAYQSSFINLEDMKIEFDAILKRLTPRIPIQHRAALESAGSRALQEWLEEEEEQQKPEYLRKRPKYYYYYEWMRSRIDSYCPALPEPVIDKLLTMDSTELDLLLQHESAIKGQAQEFLDVYNADGARALETYVPPSLTWEEVKALKGPGTIGLGYGADAAPGAGFLEGERDSDRALIGGKGEAGMLTDAERQVPKKGERMQVPRLPPDQSRDINNIVEAYSHEKLLLEKPTSPAASSHADDEQHTSSIQTKTSFDNNIDNEDKLRTLNARQQVILKHAEKAIKAANPDRHRLHENDNTESSRLATSKQSSKTAHESVDDKCNTDRVD